MSNPSLGTAASFAVLTNLPSSVTTSDTPLLDGNFATASVTGTYTVENGTDYSGSNYSNSTVTTALSDATNAYNNIIAMTPTGTINDQLDTSSPIGPGVYNNDSYSTSNPFTLQGTASDYFIFVSTSNVISPTINISDTMTLDGANPQNIYWVTENGSVLISTSNFYGNVLSQGNIRFALGGPYTQEGSLIALNPTTAKTVTLQSGTYMSLDQSCLHPFTKIMTNRGYICIENIKSGDTVYNYKNEPIEVLYNIKILRDVKDWVRIQKDSISHNVPNFDLYITDSHPIFINNEYTQPKNLINNRSIAYTNMLYQMPLYSLCTKEQQFVFAHNLPVSTWKETDFMNTKIYKYNAYEKL